MKISFLGAVKSVTGSCHLIEFKDKKILLDCGLFQGRKETEELNYKDLGFNPAEIDYLFLSHSHIDHCGRIPLLAKKGFKGIIYSTKATYDLCEIMLIDSAYIQEKETEWKNIKARRTNKEIREPLYTQSDATNSLSYFKPVLYEQVINVNDDIKIKFNDAGHILGSSIIEMWFNEDGKTIKVVYSGDLGMKEKPLLKDPSIIEEADYVIIESTYGNRLHDKIEKRTEILTNIILNTTRKDGTVIIPSFAVGRTQEMIYELNRFYDGNEKSKEELLNIPVYIDSPLATKATEVFKRNAHVFDEEAREYVMIGDNPLEFSNLHFTQSVEESKALNRSFEPKVIISASGMCDAGRIKHHLKHNLWKENSSVIFVGYQAEGTLGRRIKDGAKTIKILGEEINVNAEIYNVEGFSGHADKDGLLEWLKGFKKSPKKVFIVHGDDESKRDFALEIKEKLNYDCIISQEGVQYEITGDDVKTPQKSHEKEQVPEKHQDSMLEKELVEKEKVSELLKELKHLKEIFENSLTITEEMIEDELNVEEYNNIKNKIIELEEKLINLTILIGK